ncbi:MAG TPA: ferrochelatase [Actinopolymorphaceae bacterium]
MTDGPSQYSQAYDAVLLVSFGGPEKPDDVVPFLENVTRGRGIPKERLLEVGEHYFAFGGRSPINDQCRALKAAVEADFAAHGIDLPVYWGNRNWEPYLTDTLRQLAADGHRRVLCFLTSAYASYSSCRQYRENLADALAGLDTPDEVELTRLPHYFQRAGFVAPFVDGTAAALERLPEGSRLVFVTHSIPTAMNDASGPPAAGGGRYVAEHQAVSAAIAGRVGRTGEWDLTYCSRSGPPSQPWLEPDINDHLENLAAKGVPGVAVVPVGFVSDHIEVIYDLDTEAAQTAQRLGLAMERVPTPGTDPRFVAVVRELVEEQVTGAASRVVGSLDPVWSNCPPGCCLNLRGERPAACGARARTS